MSGTLSPYPVLQFLDETGVPYDSGKLYSYAAGTETALATYSDVDLAVANANPLVLDSAGRGVVYLAEASYKLVLKDSADATVWTQDNVASTSAFNVGLRVTGTGDGSVTAGDVVYLSDGAGARTAGRWYQADADTVAYSSRAPAVGFCITAPSASGEACVVQVAGRVTGLSGLTAGTTYYASGTAGALTSTRPSSARLIGVADTTTSIIVTSEPSRGFARYEDSVIANVGNVDAGEDTLDSHNISAGKIDANGQIVRGWYAGVAANNANGKTLKIHIDDTATDTTIINVPITASKAIDWVAEFAVIRSSSTTARSWARVTDGAGGAAVDLHEIEVNASFGCIWANAVEVRLTAEATTTDDVEVVAGFIEIVSV